LGSLEKIPIIIKACNECGLSRNTIYRWKKEDEKFREKMDKAIEMGEINVSEVTHLNYYSLINKGYWPAIKYHLTHSPTRQEKSIIQMLDKETEKQREILEKWRNGNIEEAKKRRAEEESKEA